MWICPKCKAEIKELDYQAYTSGTEWGRASLINRKPTEEDRRFSNIITDWEYSDGETTDTNDYEYTCRECDNGIELNEIEWKEENKEGVIYYLDAGRVRGVLLWNVWEQVPNARALIAAPGPFSKYNVKGTIKMG